MTATFLKFLTISFISGLVNSQHFVEPPLCGKSVITNSRFKRFGEIGKNGDSTAERARILPFVASVQKFDTGLKSDGDIFDKRLSGAFVGTILGPTVVLVACRCVARHMGRVGGDEMSTAYTRQFGVMAGTPWDYSPMDGAVGQIRFVSRIVVHPKCQLLPSLYLWDLAVLVLKIPFQFVQNKVQAARIPMTNAETNQFLKEATLGIRKTCFTVGWGWAFNSHKSKNLELKLHPLLIQSFDRCNASTAGYFKAHDAAPTDMYVCVETAEPYLRLRRTGDTGSPMLGFSGANDSTERVQYIVMGIKSEEDTATPDGFSLFTRLDVDLDWLREMRRNPPGARSSSSSDFVSSHLLLFIGLKLNIWDSC